MVISGGHLSGEGANAQHAFSINAVTILLKVYKVYLFIYLAEIRFVRGLVDTEVMVGQRVTLTCETSDDVASVDWLRNDEHLASRDQTGCHAYELSAGAGRVHWLTILSAARSDEAKYTCTCGDDVTSGLLLVEGASNALVIIIIIITSCCSTYSERPRRCCHLPNDFGSRWISPILHNGQGDFPPQHYHFPWGSGPPPGVHNSSAISIGSAVLAQLTVVTNRQTDRARYICGHR